MASSLPLLILIVLMVLVVDYKDNVIFMIGQLSIFVVVGHFSFLC